MPTCSLWNGLESYAVWRHRRADRTTGAEPRSPLERACPALPRGPRLSRLWERGAQPRPAADAHLGASPDPHVLALGGTSGAGAALSGPRRCYPGPPFATRRRATVLVDRPHDRHPSSSIGSRAACRRPSCERGSASTSGSSIKRAGRPTAPFRSSCSSLSESRCSSAGVRTHANHERPQRSSRSRGPREERGD